MRSNGRWSSGAGFRRLVLADKFFAIFDEADQHDHGRARQANEKHYFQRAHCENRQAHEEIVACLLGGREPFLHDGKAAA